MFEIVKTAGRAAERIPGTPLFDTRAEAENFASQYLREHPHDFQNGLEGCGARRRLD